MEELDHLEEATIAAVAAGEANVVPSLDYRQWPNLGDEDDDDYIEPKRYAVLDLEVPETEMEALQEAAKRRSRKAVYIDVPLPRSTPIREFNQSQKLFTL
ncbi:hypothetical protein EG327_004781 [Venturia inaequalis]|uniref:Uncharacterized protein n=1 Tax=Venturia inaequalis TaxID=5025 RepID=A0A8H3VCP1_VENIN|nr:hypothetical protein EG327_004781 [Venturia inaequalis]